MEYVLGVLALALLVGLVVCVVIASRRNEELQAAQIRLKQFEQERSAHRQAAAAAQAQALESRRLSANISARLEHTEDELSKLEAKHADERSKSALAEVDLIRANAEKTEAQSQIDYLQGLVSELKDRIQAAEELAGQEGARRALLEEKYGPLIDFDAEIEARRLEVRDLDAKRKELRQIEEDLFFVDVGVYKPHFDWTDSAKYKMALEEHYERHKAFVKSDRATASGKNWSVDGDKKEGKKLSKDLSKLVLRAFNAECEAAISKVRWNNFEVMKNRIDKAYDAINKLVTRWKISITNAYRQLWIKELILTHEYKEQLEKEREEQRRINEQMREEARVERERLRAVKQKEDEEAEAARALQKTLEEHKRLQEEADRRLAQAVGSARLELERERAKEAGEFSAKIAELEAALAQAHAESERAKSNAQLTKNGYVYIISNIGSFGEDVYKIGLTRREDPQDRIRELGDASVPFFFDVHGMIYALDAPKLEHDLHLAFHSKRVNLVNERKEFFKVTLDEIITKCRELGHDVQLTLVAEAKEYRQTLAMRNNGASAREDAVSTGQAVVFDATDTPGEPLAGVDAD